MATRNNLPSPPIDRKLTITRICAVLRSLVCKAWTGPEQIKQWWGPRGVVTLSCEMDFRRGGLWRTRSQVPDGQEYVAQSVVREIVEPERLAFTYAWEDADGKPKHKTVVTITFTEQNGKTLLAFHQGIFGTTSSRDAHEEGWSSFFERLSEYLPHA